MDRRGRLHCTRAAGVIDVGLGHRPRRLVHGEPALEGDDLYAAWDWDSAIAAPEPVLAGLASAVYPVTAAGTEATVAESEAFLDAYQWARGCPFNRSELTEAWAAGLWVRSFDAKKQFATDGTARSLSEAEALERGRRAVGL
jgi:hypothetical protein